MRITSKAGKTIGTVTTDDRIFHKRVRGSVHMLREPASWCIDSEVVEILDKLNCESIEVIDTETQSVYTVDFAKFQEKAFTIDRGYGEQKALPLGYWKITS